MLASAILSALILCVAILMHATHHATWRRASADASIPAYRRNYLRLQFQRRMAVCYILAALAAAIMIGHFIPRSIFFIIFWGCVMLLILWMVVLAMVDMMATRNLILVERDQQIARRRALEQQFGKRSAAPQNPAQDSATEEPHE
ncbi:hypothetical protein [Blastopirellula marina]|uniref:Uncharacterized protein n=1 Tax=Blastopirellula marina DSM 3645 TaxID=314230 RepID=A3ZNB6_9BACT|nr:hypothetical protein [Blastopirellula marina]EAQ81811.1 hypothetical protein DSM3645_16705 [Blastopirellula marina DSM 3645]